MTITPQWKDELRARITLSSVVMRTTKLTRAGREWKACCPFHDEKTPSFYVNDQKGFYHCFGCGAHGDVISWMTEQRGLSFIDACKELAAEAGMEVPAPDPVAAKKAEKRAELVDVTSEAQQFFFDTLRSPDGRKAMEYLNGRGLKSEILDEFGFGYAPDSKQALPAALTRIEDQMLVETGMRIRTDEGTTYDRFRDRVMLPIQDARGRVIAFGGRILGKRDGVAKYLNSPDTPLFDKGRTLYNLHRAAPAAHQTGRVIVVEGYMDVVALAQAGIADAVAPLGTALTETQLEMLWRMVETPVLCFDGDEAGYRAAIRAVERALPLLKAPNSLRVLRLPNGLDPDDLIRSQGSAAFEKLLTNAMPLVQFVWEAERDATPLDTPEQKAYLRRRLIDQAYTIKDEELRRLYRRELVDLYYQQVYPKKFGANTVGGHGLLSRENLARLSYFVGDGSREVLLRAALAAIARYPQLFDRYKELIDEYDPPTPEIEEAVDVFWEASDSLLEGSALPAKLDEIARWKGPIAFPFLAKDASQDFVQLCLDEAFVVLVDKPKIEKHLDQAAKRIEADPTEENQMEFQRLIQVKQRIANRERGIARIVMQ